MSGGEIKNLGFKGPLIKPDSSVDISKAKPKAYQALLFACGETNIVDTGKSLQPGLFDDKSGKFGGLA